MSQPPRIDFEEHWPRMYRVALRLVGNPELACEAVQNACMRALKAMSSFDGKSSMSTWLHRITVNCAIDQIRDSRRAAEMRSVADADLAGMLACLEPGPATRAERSELHDIARMLVEALPDDCRSAFVLTQLDGYSYDEVAAIVQEPRGTIASRVFRAKHVLLEKLSEAMTGGPNP